MELDPENIPEWCEPPSNIAITTLAAAWFGPAVNSTLVYNALAGEFDITEIQVQNALNSLHHDYHVIDIHEGATLGSQQNIYIFPSEFIQYVKDQYPDPPKNWVQACFDSKVNWEFGNDTPEEVARQILTYKTGACRDIHHKFLTGILKKHKKNELPATAVEIASEGGIEPRNESYTQTAARPASELYQEYGLLTISGTDDNNAYFYRLSEDFFRTQHTKLGDL